MNKKKRKKQGNEAQKRININNLGTKHDMETWT